MLEAAGIRSGSVTEGAQHVLIVRSDDAERAGAEIAKYAAENRGWPQRPAAPLHPIARGRDAAIVYVIALTAAYVAQRTGSYGFDWSAAGCADAGAIRAGAWWRSLTALMLHADVLHLAGNALFGALFGVMLAQSVGVGWTWLAFAITGGLGNEINAWIQAPAHVSIGGSTAVFGMLGTQVAYEWMRRRQLRYGRWRRFAPMVMGLALLAWLGGGGTPADPSRLHGPLEDYDVVIRKIDVGAHLLGFAVGVVCGVLLGWPERPLLPGRHTQAGIAACAVVLMIAAWILAFRM